MGARPDGLGVIGEVAGAVTALVDLGVGLFGGGSDYGERMGAWQQEQLQRLIAYRLKTGRDWPGLESGADWPGFQPQTRQYFIGVVKGYRAWRAQQASRELARVATQPIVLASAASVVVALFTRPRKRR